MATPKALSMFITPISKYLVRFVGTSHTLRNYLLANLFVVFKIFPAKMAAPKPLSIFITPIPEAQELSMVSKADKPLKLAP
jgi:hypothetical protein